VQALLDRRLLRALRRAEIDEGEHDADGHENQDEQRQYGDAAPAAMRAEAGHGCSVVEVSPGPHYTCTQYRRRPRPAVTWIPSLALERPMSFRGSLPSVCLALAALASIAGCGGDARMRRWPETTVQDPAGHPFQAFVETGWREGRLRYRVTFVADSALPAGSAPSAGAALGLFDSAGARIVVLNLPGPRPDTTGRAGLTRLRIEGDLDCPEGARARKQCTRGSYAAATDIGIALW
jgi:hypothetical protein